MKTIAAKPIETILGTLYPSMSEKLSTGEVINSGSIPGFRTHVGSASLKHDGKRHKLSISNSINGSTVVQAESGRWFFVSLEKLIDHAIAAGLLDSKLVFEKAKPSRKPQP